MNIMDLVQSKASQWKFMQHKHCVAVQKSYQVVPSWEEWEWLLSAFPLSAKLYQIPSAL